jgi:hypothetical protein
MADILGMTERSVYRLGDKVAGYVKIGGRVYYRKSTFERATVGSTGSEPEKVPVYGRHDLG